MTALSSQLSVTAMALSLLLGVAVILLALPSQCDAGRMTDKSIARTTSPTLLPFATRQQSHQLQQLQHYARIVTQLRGGDSSAASATVEEGDDEDAEEADDDDDDDNDNEEDTKEQQPATMSTSPVKLLFSTSLHNPIVDARHELTPTRKRTIADLKKSLSKSLPGKPPILGIELVYDGSTLSDDMIVDELFEDEEEEEAEVDGDEESSNVRKLLLNMVPPMDDKFLVELAGKLSLKGDTGVDDTENHNEEERDEEEDALLAYQKGVISTKQLLEAYFLNQALMVRNQQLLLGNDNADSVDIAMRFQVEQQAHELLQAFQEQVSEEVWKELVVEEHANRKSKSKSNGPEWKGQRYRSGKVATTEYKTMVQTHLNVDWFETIKTFVLFLFFGYFGGKTFLSRALLILAAPLSILIQTRLLKVWIKTAFYCLMNPPLILQSLLPAPEQAILSANVETLFEDLYGSDKTVDVGVDVDSRKRVGVAAQEEEEEEESEDYEDEEEEESEDESDSDEE